MTGRQIDVAGWCCFLALLAVLVTVEGLCARLAFDTLGEVSSSMLMVAVALNLIPALLFAIRLRIAAVILALLIALAIVPYQVVLGARLLALEHEGSEIVGWAYWQKLKTGRFPASLASYRFSAPSLRQQVTDYRVNPDGRGFAFSFYVGTRGTSHSFGATNDDGGHWGYYPD